MGKFDRNYEEVERREAVETYAGDAPKPGIYDAVLTTCKEHTSSSGSVGTEWTFDISDGTYTGWRGWVYTNDDTAAWKEVQILEAVGILGEGKNSIATTHEKIVSKAGQCRIKVRNETYEDEKRGKITTILPPASNMNGSEKKKKKSGDPF